MPSATRTPHAVLLLTTDTLLAERVRRALPVSIALDLQVAAAMQPSADSRGWLLVLVDAHDAPGALPAGEAWPSLAPVLWLGEAPRPTETGPLPFDLRRRIIDYLDRAQPSSKLAFVLHQHLTAAYLRRLRSPDRGGPVPPRAPVATPDQLQCQLNNALAGILGNAELAGELAHDAGRRLAQPLGQRLECIAELAAQLRDLLRVYPLAKAEIPKNPA